MNKQQRTVFLELKTAKSLQFFFIGQPLSLVHSNQLKLIILNILLFSFLFSTHPFFMSNTKLEEIISKIAEQENKPDFSFLKNNPEAQAKLLMALLCSSKAKSDLKECNEQISCSVATASSSKNDVDNLKKLDSSIEKVCLTKKPGRKPISEDEEVKSKRNSI